jgi:NADH-quinone oxidoreductase subunit M
MVGMLAERFHSRRLADFGGLWGKMPVYGAFMLFFAMASAGLPGLSNFVGELMIMIGSFRVYPVGASLAFFGIVVGLAYVLRLLQGTVLGKPGPLAETAEAADLDGREILILSIFALAVLLLGVHPGPLLDLIREPLNALAANWPG